MSDHPGGKLASRPLQFIWIADCSGSMSGKKIQSLNYAIQESIKPMQDVANENPNAQVFVRAIKFSNNAQWHVSQPTDIQNFKWPELITNGETHMGEALRLAAEALKAEAMPPRGLPPVLVLISDGQPTDDFAGGLQALMKEPWGMKAVRIAVAIGEDADTGVLQDFIGNPELAPLVATNVQDLVKKIKWASTVPLKAASNPASRTKDSASGVATVPIPAPPSNTQPTSPADIW